MRGGSRHRRSQHVGVPAANRLERLEDRCLLSASTIEAAVSCSGFLESVDHEQHDGHEFPGTPLPSEITGPEGSNADDTGSGTLAPLSQTFFLHSNPNAAHTIYLDFDGHVTSGTSWNFVYANGDDIVTPAYSFEGGSSFSDNELTRIQYIWQRVAEDYLPFDVDVTTEEPAAADLQKSGSGDTAWGIRMVIGGNGSWYNSGVGGTAYRNSFNYSSDTPAFVFEDNLGGGSEKWVSEAIAHEAGHTLGLSHDGPSYYSGHGSGDTGWAPIMGLGYYKNLTQWSKGEYANANNAQDDLAIISSNNGFGHRTDDHGNTDATASPLSLSGTSISATGIIERNTDADVFSFTTAAGSINIDVDPAARGPNLDVLVELYSSSGQLVASSNPTNAIDANINLSVQAGTYYLHVSGTGKGDPLNGGYTDYGSLGYYRISGSVADNAPVALLSINSASAQKAEGDSGNTAFTFTVSRSGTTSSVASVQYAVSGSGQHPAAASDFGGTLPSGTVAFAAGETSKTVTVNVSGDGSYEQEEGFTVTLSNPSAGATIQTAQATGTILNDDLAVLSVSAAAAQKAEGNSGLTAFTFTVARSGATNHAVTVDYAVTGSGNSAANAADFGGTLPSGTVSFSAGQTSKTLTINVTGDLTAELTETFTVTLTAPSTGAQIQTAQATGTIVNDETVSVIAQGATDLIVTERGTQASFTLRLSHQPSAVVTISISSSAPSEGQAQVSQVQFNSSNWNVPATVTITGVDDTDIDGDVGFQIELGPTSSSDPAFDGIAVADVPVVNTDSESALLATAYQVDQQLGLRFTGSYSQNWAGLSEKWMIASGNTWYFILPDGSLYHLIRMGAKSTVLQDSQLVATFGPAFYDDATRIHDASPTDANLDRMAVRLDLELLLYRDGSYAENWARVGEKWIRSLTSGWHFIMPDGSLYRWTGASRGDQFLEESQLIAVLDPTFAANPELLHEASANLPAADLAYGLTFGLGLTYTGQSTNWGGAGEKWFQDRNNAGYFMTPDGAFYRWTGAASGNGFVAGSLHLADLGPSYHSDPLSLINAPQPSVSPINQALALDAMAYLLNQRLRLTGVDANRYNYGGEGEVWFTSQSGTRYFITPGGGFYRDTGAASGQGFLSQSQFLQQLDARFHGDPGRLVAAQADSVERNVLAVGLARSLQFQEVTGAFNWGGLQEKWYRSSHGWYFLTPDGGLYQWTGGSGNSTILDSSTLLTHLDSSSYNRSAWIAEAYHVAGVNDFWVIDTVFEDIDLLIT